MKYHVKISNLSFDIELTPIGGTIPIEPIEPPVVTPWPPNPPTEPDFDFDKVVTSGTGIIYLPESFHNKEVVIESKGMLKPSIEGLIGKNTILTFKDWDSTPTQLYNLNEKESFFTRGITVACPINRPICTGFPDKELFGWDRDKVVKGKFAVIDAPEIKDKKRVTFGLSRFCYSSDSEENIYLIAKNVFHNGFNFMQAKNPYRGNLNVILQNVSQHNPIIEEPQSHYYTPTSIKVRIRVDSGIAKIISNNTFDQILTWVGYNNGNQRSILHFDRYAYDINDSALIDNKTLIIDRPDEFHPLDVTDKGLIISKQIDGTRATNWVYSYEPSSEPKRKTLPNGEFDAYIVYKGNALFQVPITKDTRFGDGYWESGVIIQSQGYGWSWYCEEFSGYIENFNGTGYFRNSGGSGIRKELIIKDSYFEKNPPIGTATVGDMPKEAQAFIEWVESL